MQGLPEEVLYDTAEFLPLRMWVESMSLVDRQSKLYFLTHFAGAEHFAFLRLCARTLRGKVFPSSEWNFDWEPEVRRLANWVQDLKRSRPGWVNTVDESIWDRIDKWIACKVNLPMDARFFYIVVPRGLGFFQVGRMDLRRSIAAEAHRIREHDYRVYGNYMNLSLSVLIRNVGS